MDVGEWLVDTSVLYALFSHNDVHHKKAVNEVKNSEPILIPSKNLVRNNFSYPLSSRI